MLDLWNHASLAVFDFLLGWMLYLPSDLVIIGLALITAGLMAIVRPFTTNQDMLARVDRDRRRLNELIREAKRNGDRPALLRYRATNNLLSLRKLAAEMKPLAIIILPVAMLATWAMFRVGYHPPQEGEPVEVVFYAQTADNAAIRSADGETMHLLPRTGLQATDGWVQKVFLKEIEPTWWDRTIAWLSFTEPEAGVEVMAVWTLEGKARARPYPLMFRFRDQTIGREIQFGQTTYSPAWDFSPDGFVTHTKLREVKLFGIVPGLGEFLPAWMVGYLVIVIPLVFVVKSVLNIY